MHYFKHILNLRTTTSAVVGEVTGKSQLTGNDFCQFYRDFQVDEVGLGWDRVDGRGRGKGKDWVRDRVGYHKSLTELAFPRHLTNNPFQSQTKS